MIDWEQIEKDLYAMKEYFTTCAGNAQPGSEAWQKYTGYVQTLTRVMTEIEERIGEEDDGK